MLTSLVGTWVRRMAQRFGGVIAKSGVTPNVLTIVGLILNILVGYILSTGQLVWGGALVLFAGAFDLLDGAVARATGQSTKFGAFLDSTLDRYSEAAIYLGLLIYFEGTSNSSLPALLIFVVIVGSLMTSYVKARAEALQMRCEVGVLARPERVIILALGLLVNQVVIALWILAFLTHLTAGQRILHIWFQAKHSEETSDEEEKVTPGRRFHLTG